MRNGILAVVVMLLVNMPVWAGETVQLDASESASVHKGKTAQNFGETPVLETKATAESFLKFDVSGMNENVSRVTLRLYASFVNRDGVQVSVRQAASDWDEKTVTWDTKPKTGRNIQTVALDKSDRRNWVEVDVSGAVKKNGPCSFVLQNKNGVVNFQSNEAQNVPHLIIAYKDGVAPQADSGAAGGAVEETLSLQPVADTYAFSGSADENFSGEDVLHAKPIEETFLKFDLPEIGEAHVKKATLKLYLSFVTGAGARVAVHGMSDNSWDAEKLTWNCKPEAGKKIADQKVSKEARRSWVEFDVTKAVETGGLCSFAVKANSPAYFLSSENKQGKGPELTVEVEKKKPLTQAAASKPAVLRQPREDAARKDQRYVDFSYWKALSVGGGGAVMGFDASARPGTVYVSADMEGIYRSDDYGDSWHIRTRDLGNVFTRVIKAHPTDEDTVYLGTMTGLWKSTDGAASWTMLGRGTDLDGVPIQQIVFDPINPSIVYAAPGLGSRENAIGINGNVRRMNLGVPEAAQSHCFKSSDGGVSWGAIRYTDKGGDIAHTMFDIAIDRADTGRMFIASTYGIFKSADGGKSWTELNTPDTHPRGVQLTPDGQWLYGTFRGELKDGTTGGIYIARVGEQPLKWVKIDQSMPERGNYWPIKLDPFDPSGRTLFAGSNDRQRVGLFKGTVTLEDEPSAEWSQYLKGHVRTTGWLDAHANEAPIVRRFGFSKPTWKDNKMWTSTGMSLYMTDLDEETAAGPVWDEKYSVETEVFGKPFFKGRGFESTFVYDTAVNENYIASGMADHGFMESYDGGESWREVNFRYPEGAGIGSNSRASAMQFYPFDRSKLIAGLGWGYGAGKGGVLYMRDVDPQNPDVDQWAWLAGGPDEKNGLVNQMILSLVFDPANADRLFLGLQRGGIWMTDDFGSVIGGGRGRFYSITESSDVIPKNIRVHEMKLDPADSGTLYVASDAGFFVGKEHGGGNWQWTKTLDGRVPGVAVAATPSGRTVVLATGSTDGEPGQSAVWLSDDQGAMWKPVLLENEIVQYGGNLSAEDLGRYRFVFPEVEANGEPGGNIYLSVTAGMRRSDEKTVRANSNFLLGSLRDDGTVVWRSMLGGLDFSHANRLVVHWEEGQPVLYNATRGAGVWKRQPSLIGNGGFEIDRDADGVPDCWSFSDASVLEPQVSVEGMVSVRLAGAVQSADFPVPSSGRGRLAYSISSFEGISGAKGELVMKDSSGNEIRRVELPVPQTVKGGWRDVSRKVLFPSDADTFYLRFEGAGVLLDNVFMEADSEWGKSVPLESDRIYFKGAKYVYREASQIAPLRFSREVLAANPAQLNFNPGVARMGSGIEMCFSTDSSTVSVEAILKPFRKEKAAYFQVYRDDELFKEFEFSRPKESDLPVEMTLCSEDGAAHNYRIVFPTTAEVVVTGLMLDVDSELETMTFEEKPVYVALGDSISQGTMALFGRSEWSYPFLLSRELGVDLYNLGVGGSRVSVAIAEMLADWEKIDLITLLVGANDFSWAAVPPEEYRANYIKLVEAVRRHHPEVPLFCITLTYTTREAGDSGDPVEAYRQVVRDVVKEFQASGDGRIFLLEGEELSGTDCLSDWVHLSIKGNKTMARNLCREIISKTDIKLPAGGE